MLCFLKEQRHLIHLLPPSFSTDSTLRSSSTQPVNLSTHPSMLTVCNRCSQVLGTPWEASEIKILHQAQYLQSHHYSRAENLSQGYMALKK